MRATQGSIYFLKVNIKGTTDTCAELEFIICHNKHSFSSCPCWITNEKGHICLVYCLIAYANSGAFLKMGWKGLVDFYTSFFSVLEGLVQISNCKKVEHRKASEVAQQIVAYVSCCRAAQKWKDCLVLLQAEDTHQCWKLDQQHIGA